MREFRVVQVDVFAERVLGGNPLAVLVDGRGLGDGEMLAIAREMNLSETTFVLPATRDDCVARVRIFTPRREVPFAGHPTVGTAWVLAREGRVPAGARRFALEEGVGPVAVELTGDDPTAPSFVWMTHPPAAFGAPVAARAAVAAALGLDERDLRPGAPVQEGSTGSRFLYVPLGSRAAVDHATLDVPRLLAALGDAGRVGVFVFAMDDAAGPGHLYSRMFAPHTSGVPEDPATGSASGPLGAYAVRHGLVPVAPRVSLVSEQGTRMGRQSFVHIALDLAGADVTRIRVGGAVVPALEGVLRL